MPQQRKLDTDELHDAKLLLPVRANTKLVQQHLQTTTGKSVKLKDVSNIATTARHTDRSNDLNDVVAQLKKTPGAVVEILTNEFNEFKGYILNSLFNFGVVFYVFVDFAMQLSYFSNVIKL